MFENIFGKKLAGAKVAPSAGEMYAYGQVIFTGIQGDPPICFHQSGRMFLALDVGLSGNMDDLINQAIVLAETRHMEIMARGGSTILVVDKNSNFEEAKISAGKQHRTTDAAIADFDQIAVARKTAIQEESSLQNLPDGSADPRSPSKSEPSCQTEVKR